jgi:hypothetical protein
LGKSCEKTPAARTSGKSMRVQKLAVALVAIQCSLVFGGLVYRATVYESIPVAPGDPYGLGDVLELLLYFVLLGSSALTLLCLCALSFPQSAEHQPPAVPAGR